MRIAITGAAGFVGGALCRAAVARGHTVIALTRRDGRAIEAREGLDVRVIDLTDTAAIGHAVAEATPDAVIHAAAVVPKDMSDRSAGEQCFLVNALGTRDVVAACVTAGVARAVLLSTASLYSPGTDAVTEGASLYPTHHAPFYVTSKLAGELLATQAARGTSTTLSVLRVASVYGPGMPATGVFSAFLRAARDGAPLRVRNGGARADFVHVDDVATAALSAAELGTDGVFNIGSGVQTSILDLARAIVSEVDPSAEVLVERTSAEPGVGTPPLDITRARTVLGWDPRPLRRGLEGFRRA